jgi:uncharacterized secreted protein with C-terminal beta-propeller domain
MSVRAGILAIAAVASFLVVGTTSGGAARQGERLRAFSGCPAFLDHVRARALPLVGPWGLVGGGLVVGLPSAARGGDLESRAGAGVEFSDTNVQEEGVDEPDLTKTDGRTLFVVANGRVSAVDVRQRRPRLLDSLPLVQGWSHELLLRGSRLLVLSQGAPAPLPGGSRLIRGPWPYASRTTVTEVDARDPARLRTVRALELEGGYLTARLVGGAVRIVLSSPLGVDLPFVAPDATTGDQAQAAERNRTVVRTATARRWLPGYTVRRNGRAVASGALVGCRSISRPARFSGLGLITVMTIDADRGLDPVDADAVVSDGRTVYASPTSLYVASERWDTRADGSQRPEDTTTAIHRFDIASPTRTHYRGSGSVPGVLLNQWSLSERDGVLRVASTELPTWWGGPRSESETVVTTLAAGSGGLVPLGRVGGLGKGERVYAVRFVGDKGYVVTFRQVDPLYTLDLSTAARPVVRGELKIRGYSAYLHPVGDDLLLGVGQDATDEGQVLGAQASLFDVSDVRRPRRLDSYALGKAWSEAEHDHRAFLWWPRARLAAIPLAGGGDRPFAGVVGLRIGRATISEAGRVAHAADVAGAPIRRSVVVGDVLYTVSDTGVKASSLTTFAGLGFVALPRTAVEPVPVP